VTAARTVPVVPRFRPGLRSTARPVPRRQSCSELIAEHDCEACHRRNVGGDGRSIYRPTGRIRTPGFLRGMVEYCNTQLNLQLFPEDVTSIAATLNRDHYRFK